MTHRLGILGIGHLAEFTLDGLMRSAAPPPILLGPRNADTAARLAERHGLPIAADAATLVADSDIVLVAVRPPQAETAVSGLPWRADQVLLSAMAGVAAEDLRRWAPGPRVVRCMPVSSAAIGKSPTAVTPDDPVARAVLERIGSVIALPDEATFEAASILGAAYGWIMALQAVLEDALGTAGLPEEARRALVSGFLEAAAAMTAADPDRSAQDMVDELCTPGTITGLGRDLLIARDALSPWAEACEAVHAKLTGAAEEA